MTIINILLVLLIVSASCLCIFLIVYLKRIFEEVEAVAEDIHYFVKNTIPVLNNLEQITHRTNRIVSEITEYWDGIDHSIRTLRENFLNLIVMKKLISTHNFTIGFIRNSKSLVKNILSKFSKY